MQVVYILLWKAKVKLIDKAQPQSFYFILFYFLSIIRVRKEYVHHQYKHGNLGTQNKPCQETGCGGRDMHV